MINYHNENLLYKILEGKVKCKLGNFFVYIRKPKFDDYIRANELYEIEYGRALENGGYTEDEMLSVMKQYEMWSDKEENEYKVIDKHIDDLKVELYNTFMAFKSRDKIKKNLEKVRERKLDLIIKRSSMDGWTAEYIAGSLRMSYLIWRNSYKQNKRYFKVGFNLADYWDLSILLTTYNKSMLMDEKIRELCKLSKWKILWSLGKSVKGVFKKSVVDLTDNQLSLISWSRFYDNVRGSMDAPSNEVIDDDDMLDGWAIVNHKKQEDERNKNVADKAVSSIHQNAEEVFIVTDTPSDAARINSLNDQYGRMIQKQKLSQAEKHGRISDFEMPVVKQELAMKINAMKHPSA